MTAITQPDTIDDALLLDAIEAYAGVVRVLCTDEIEWLCMIDAMLSRDCESQWWKVTQ
jgi:hypothetical protein